MTHRQTRHKRGTVTPAQQPKGNPNSHPYRNPHPQPQTTLNPHCTNPPQAPHRNPRTATTTPPLLVLNNRNHQKETLIVKTNSNPHPMRPHPQTTLINTSHSPFSPRNPVPAHIPTPPVAPQTKPGATTPAIPHTGIIPVRKPQLEQHNDTPLPLSSLSYIRTHPNHSSSLHYQHTATTHHKTPSAGILSHKQNTTPRKSLLEHLLEKPKETSYTLPSTTREQPQKKHTKKTPPETTKRPKPRTTHNTNQQTTRRHPHTKPHHTHKPRGRAAKQTPPRG